MAGINLAEETSNIKGTILNFIIPLSAIVGSMVLIGFIIYPTYKALPDLKKNKETQITLRDSLGEKLNRINRFVDYKSVLEENLVMVNSLIPNDENVPGALDEVDQIAQESGMKVIRLNYSVGQKNSEGTPSVLISLGIEGTYDQMILFFENVEKAARLVDVTTYRYSLDTQDGGIVRVDCTLTPPYQNVEVKATTDEPIALDISSPDYINFLNKIKEFKYYETAGSEQQSEARRNATQEEITADQPVPPIEEPTSSPTPTPVQQDTSNL